MSRGPEANFWSTIRRNLPEKCFATRIENKHGGGVPDLHAIWDGIAFWAELKVTKTNKPKYLRIKSRGIWRIGLAGAIIFT